jgi:Helix-turn-helix domain
MPGPFPTGYYCDPHQGPTPGPRGSVLSALRAPARGEILWGVDGDPLGGHSRPEDADMSGESGWVTTEVAANAVRVSPRTIRRYIERGELKAKPQGEGVNRTWLVSVDSLYALRASRTVEEESAQDVRVEDSMADVYRDLATRLEHRAAEAAELRTRLELTERTQSTFEEEAAKLREERDRLRAELEAERSKGFWQRLFGP